MDEDKKNILTIFLFLYIPVLIVSFITAIVYYYMNVSSVIEIPNESLIKLSAFLLPGIFGLLAPLFLILYLKLRSKNYGG